MPAPKGNKNAVGNKGGTGQPPKECTETHIKQAYKLSLLGCTDKEIASVFDISEPTLNKWKNESLDFLLALKKGKDVADAKVAQSLYKRAIGYSHPDVDIKIYEGQIIQTPLIKHYPPDTTAAIFWLKNRKKAVWRDKQEIGLTDSEGKDVKIGYGSEK